MADAGFAKGVVLQKAGEIEQRRVGHIHERTNGMREDVLQARPPEVRPDGTKSADDTIGNERTKILRHLGEKIETDGPFES